MINVESGAVTIASVADSTNTIFRLVRNVSGDDNTGDLRLVGVKIFYTTDNAIKFSNLGGKFFGEKLSQSRKQ